MRRAGAAAVPAVRERPRGLPAVLGVPTRVPVHAAVRVQRALRVRRAGVRAVAQVQVLLAGRRARRRRRDVRRPLVRRAAAPRPLPPGLHEERVHVPVGRLRPRRPHRHRGRALRGRARTAAAGGRRPAATGGRQDTDHVCTKHHHAAHNYYLGANKMCAV